MRCDENMIFICVIQNYMVFIHDSHQPNIHPFNLTSILPPIGSRWATASPRCDLKRLGDSPEATSDRPTLPGNLVGSCGESSLWHACRRWFPWEMTTTLVLVTQKKNGNRLCQSSSNMRKPAIQPQKKCIHWFICIHHHSSIIEATLNHSTVVASIHLTSSIPEMPAAHQETWCKSQPVKYHPKVETLRRCPFFCHFCFGLFGGVCFFQGHDDSRGTQQKWPPPWTRIIAILLEWHRKYNSNCSAPLWFNTMILNTESRQSLVQLQFKDSFDLFKVLLLKRRGLRCLSGQKNPSNRKSQKRGFAMKKTAIHPKDLRF